MPVGRRAAVESSPDVVADQGGRLASEQTGYDIRAIQELLGHWDVGTTMISARVLNLVGRGVRSPIDDL